MNPKNFCLLLKSNPLNFKKNTIDLKNMMPRLIIRELIENSCKKLFPEKVRQLADQISVVKTSQKEHGDYTANIKGFSFEEQEKLVDDIKKSGNFKRYFSEVRFEKPVFINFFLSDGYLQEKLKEILKAKENFGELKTGEGKKIQVEFISANPTGPLTLGNARGGPFGDVLANVFKKAGFETEKAYYINDCGNQILTLGHSVLKDEKAEYKGEYIDQLNKKIKDKDPRKAGEIAAELLIKNIEKTVKNLKISFDEWFLEKKLHDSGAVDKTIDILKQKGLTYEKEGALWFKSAQFGDGRDRVLIKKDKGKTYLAGDIAYHRYKFDEKKFDKAINIWGADHYGDIAGLKAGVEALGHKGKLDFVLLQFVTLLEKGEKIKMSKRKGVYVTMDELLKIVNSDIIRFFFLTKSADSHLDFDLDLAKEQSEKNPVFYVQYAHARICSILKKAGKKISYDNYELLKESSEKELIKELIRWPEIIEDTVKDYQVQRIPQYATNLAASFHQFYGKCRVISENKQITKARMSLVMATKIVLKNTLDLMGISAPEKM